MLAIRFHSLRTGHKMTQRVNEFSQPIGPEVPGWKEVPHPGHVSMTGRYARVEPIAVNHVDDLFAAFKDDPSVWTYNRGYGPFETPESLREWVEGASGVDEQPYFAIINQDTNKAVGMASYMRINQAQGLLEVGSITFSPHLQRTRAATEAMYLMMSHVFELGYRRYEWKCDSLNEPSCRAAERFGFTAEGVFRQAIVYKGRNRDTAWFSILDSEWPAMQRAFKAWLEPSNFNAEGQQLTKLSALRETHAQAA
eukprot:TRINITY_DN3173_c0_g1_i2.p1 TRINITY_DN3173_c0_g1~~TRINITY_DN3173_c0_g1_i2.p1  ORF type:complete len:253 (+),score=32.95 TRINITY_DN3173_c0_g1_i2:54-812(+)